MISYGIKDWISVFALRISRNQEFEIDRVKKIKRESKSKIKYSNKICAMCVCDYRCIYGYGETRRERE